MRLRTAPFDIDVPALAAGLLDLFDEDERDRLRLGLLPAVLMDRVKAGLREKFLDKFEPVEITADDPLCYVVPGTFVAYCNRGGDRFEAIEFRMEALLSEALHAIALELYKIGDLVV